MKIATIIARSLLGLIFVVFGSNMFFQFIHMPPPPEGPAREFMTALFLSHYLYVVGALQVAGGVLLLKHPRSSRHASLTRRHHEHRDVVTTRDVAK